jgi:hypothetical protein
MPPFITWSIFMGGQREVWEKENELELQDRGKMASFEEI